MAELNEDALGEIAKFEALADKAFFEMHEASSPRGCYSDLKDYFADAIGAAERAGLAAEAKGSRNKLNNCRAVYRNQFAGFER
jgi:hypothetical protein